MDTVRAANRTRKPEDSIPLRVSILAAVGTGVVALAAEHAVSVTIAMVVLVVLPVAYWVSYVRRAKDNWAIKLAVTIGALVGVIRFFGQVKGITSLDEARFPLADIFLWVQVLHSFDLPQRKDLNFSLGSSLALMAVAGSVSQDLGFALYLGVYFVFVVAALTLGYRSEIEDGAAGWMRPRSARGRARRPAREIVQGAAATVLAGAILFLILPQPSGVRSFALPFNLGAGLGATSNGGITNPGFGEGTPGFRSNAANYYGFGDRMDLRVRGDLSDELVMRVRASAPALWRGAVFDKYDGVSWGGDPDDPVPFVGEPPYLYPPAFRSLGPRQEITETFYVEAEQPNLVFSGGQPDEVYYEGGVSIDALGALRTDSTLTPGTVYSVISSRGAAAPAELRRAGPITFTEELRRYVELPNVPKRVIELARSITAGATNEYDAVKSIERYLRENYRYSIDSPVPPPGRDAVDYFLFDDDVGFCEQFASATAVMLRSLGYPTRVVVGYTTGSRNPFTGYYEVHGSDAHSWVEVWFPKLGWYEFDPTFAVPPARGDVAQLVPLVRFLRFIAAKARILFSGDAATVAKAVFVLVAIAVIAVGAGLVWRRRRPVARRVRASPTPFTGGAVAMAFHRYEQALRAAGRGRTVSETAAELVERAAPPTPETKSALEVFERERYGYPPPRPQEAIAAANALDRMAEAARREAREAQRGSP